MRRLRLLTGVVERAGTGHFAPLPVAAGAGKSDEVETLIRTFNTMEEQLLAREKELLQSKKLAAIGTLAAGVAHELNNPLSNIYTTAQRLLKKSGDTGPDYLKRGLNDIFGETMRVKTIVSDLLGFARGREPNPRFVELRGLVGGAWAQLERVRDISGVRLRLTLVPEEIVICVDPEQLEQVFLNLFANACDAMAGAGELTVRAEEEETAVRIRVSDTGAGMSRETLDKIFEPFFTTKDKGTGLGLAIVFNIVQKHGGSIQAESAGGAGTSFVITLPKAAPRPGQPPRPFAAPGKQRSLTHMAFRILVAEDEQDHAQQHRGDPRRGGLPGHGRRRRDRGPGAHRARGLRPGDQRHQDARPHRAGTARDDPRAAPADRSHPDHRLRQRQRRRRCDAQGGERLRHQALRSRRTAAQGRQNRPDRRL